MLGKPQLRHDFARCEVAAEALMAGGAKAAAHSAARLRGNAQRAPVVFGDEHGFHRIAAAHVEQPLYCAVARFAEAVSAPAFMTILLAPMEGLLDCALRDALTQVGGVQRCVSEFIRVTDQLLPLRSFTRVAPELLNGGFTPAGVPLRPQLLGSDPACLAENAAPPAAARSAGPARQSSAPRFCQSQCPGPA